MVTTTINRIEASPSLQMADLEPLRGLWNACEGEGRMRYGQDAMVDIKSADDLFSYLYRVRIEARWVVFILTVDGKPSGFLIAEHQLGTFKKRPVIHSSDLYISKTERRKGYGLTIKKDLEEYARIVNASRIISETTIGNYASRGLNFECGYVGTMMEPEEQEIAHLLLSRSSSRRIVMTKELD